MLGRIAARVAYYGLIAPFGAIARLFADPLHTKAAPTASNWQPVEAKGDSLERARRQT